MASGLSGQTTLAELVVKLGLDDSGLKKGSKSAETQLESIKKKVLSLAAGFVSFKGIAAGIEFNKMKQNAEIAFSTMLGSAEKAKSLIGELKDLGMKTPLEFKDIRQAGQTLLQFGIAAKDVTKTVRMLGDVSLGDSEKLKQLAVAFGQVSSAGKLTGQDLLQFINAGFNPLNVIAQKTGETMADLRDRMSKGGISAQEVADAFNRATSEGGQFNNALGELANSLTGAESNFRDIADTTLGALTEGAVKPLTEAYIKLSASMTRIINGPAKDFGSALGGAITTISTVLQGVIWLVSKLPGSFTAAAAAAAALGVLFGPWGAALGLVLATVGGIVTATKQAKEAGEAYNKVMKEGVKDTTDVEKALAGVNNQIAIYEKYGQSGKELENLKQIKRELIDAQKGRAMNALGAKAVAEAAEKEAEAIKKAEAANGPYIKSRALVLETLNEENKEHDEIVAKINQLQQTPWAKGELETQRLEAIEKLKKKLIELSDTEKALSNYNADLKKSNAEREADDIIRARDEAFANEIKTDKEREAEAEAQSERRKQNAKDEQTKLEQSVASVGEALKNLANSALKDGLSAFVEVVAAGGDGMEALAKGVDVFWNKILEAMPELLLNAGTTAIANNQIGLGAALIAASGLVSLGNATGFFGDVGSAVGDFFSGVGEAVGGLFGFAGGTDYAPGGLAVVGEQGPEIVNLPRGASVMNNAQTNAMMRSGMGGGVTVNINSPRQLDIIEASRIVKSTMRELSFQGAM